MGIQPRGGNSNFCCSTVSWGSNQRKQWIFLFLLRDGRHLLLWCTLFFYRENPARWQTECQSKREVYGEPIYMWMLSPLFWSNYTVIYCYIPPPPPKKKRNIFKNIYSKNRNIFTCLLLKHPWNIAATMLRFLFFSFLPIDGDMLWFLSCDKCTCFFFCLFVCCCFFLLYWQDSWRVWQETG